MQNIFLPIMQHAENCETVDGAGDGLLNKQALAVKLKVSKRTVDAWMRQRRLPFIKVGKTVRFRWPDVLEKFNAYRVN